MGRRGAMLRKWKKAVSVMLLMCDVKERVGSIIMIIIRIMFYVALNVLTVHFHGKPKGQNHVEG